MRIALAAGGSAGHVEPALNLADTLMARDPQTAVVVIGGDRGIESRLVPERGYDLRTVPAVPLPRRPGADLLRLPGRLRRSVAATTRILDDIQADVVVGFGGYAALPAYLAGRRRHIPVVVHEANARPGIANRVGARLTPWVAAAVPGSLPGATHVGMPLRPAIRALAADPGARMAARDAARAALELDPTQPCLLVFGGSLGARRLNEVVLSSAGDLADAGIQVLHAVGDRAAGAESGAPAGEAGRPAYRMVPYLDRMDLAYAAADLAITRAGAMTCAEVAAVGLPAVYVPLPIGNGEQRLNAEPVVAAGGGLLVEDAHFTAGVVHDDVIPLVLDPARLARMGEAARAHAVRDGDERLADLVVAAVAAGRRP